VVKPDIHSLRDGAEHEDSMKPGMRGSGPGYHDWWPGGTARWTAGAGMNVFVVPAPRPVPAQWF